MQMLLPFIIDNMTTTITTTLSAWTSQNPVFSRPGYSNIAFYYDTFEIKVYTAGWYSIGSSSDIDTYGYFYNGTFVPNNPEYNLAASSDNDAELNQFRFQVYLEPYHTYTLVATTHSEWMMGPYTILVLGMRNVTIYRTTFRETTTRSYGTTEWGKFFIFGHRILLIRHFLSHKSSGMFVMFRRF